MTYPQGEMNFGYLMWTLPDAEFVEGAFKAVGYYSTKMVTILPKYGLVITIISEYGEGIVGTENDKIITDFIIKAFSNTPQSSPALSIEFIFLVLGSTPFL